jgi:hypothetical protein
MSARATTIAQGFSQKLLKEMYDKSLVDTIVNRDYEGEINGVGSKLNILNFDRISEKTYNGTDLGSPDSLTENNATLTIDQYKSFYWKEKTLDNWLSYIKNPHPTVVTQKADERNKNMDTFVLGLYADVGAGNRIGTDADDATTITITITSGAFVVSGGTPVASTWVGRGIKAVGHSKWYRVLSVSSTTEGIICDDEDDITAHYSGGTITDKSYVVEAITPLAITTANLLNKVAQVKKVLDKAESYGYNAVPDTDRFIVVPPEFETLLVQGTGIALHVPDVYTELVKRGMITQLLGFNVFKSNRLTGDNTNGYRVIAGHSLWCTFAEKLLAADIEEDLVQNFGSAYKDLFVYGAKVADPRRHFAAEGYWTFTGA